MEYESMIHDDDNRAALRQWLVSTFKRRECIAFLESKSHSAKCECGRRFDEHKKATGLSLNRMASGAANQNASAQPEAPPRAWRIQNNTETFPTNAFGTLEFQGADIYATRAEYIRLSFDTKPQNIIKLLKDYWQLELPKLIISVHGGIANFGLQPKLKQAIQRGLIQVAKTSQIWIVTAGTDTGVVKHVGEILRDYYPKSRNNVIAIGIAPWGVVNERQSLIGHGIEVPYYWNNNRTINSGGGFNLNNCHSYFLLVDDGTVGKYGCEISFRRRFERFLSRHKSEIFMDFDLRPKMLDVMIEEKITLQNHHTIPLVCLVIEGGTNIIQTVLVNVKDTPPVPVVVCDGSGRAADLIAFTHRYVYINPVTKRATIDADVQEQLISTIMKTFAYDKNQADYLFIQLMNCVTNKDLISIYRLGDEDNHEIDLAILTASLKVIDLELGKQFDTIMSWNRPDIAKKYILLQGLDSEKQILEEKMFDALSQDKVEFVKLLLEYGVNLQKFLTFKRLQDLYNCKKGPPNTLLLVIKDVIKKLDSTYRISLLDIGLVVDKLIGNGYVCEYSKREFKSRYVKFLHKRNTTLINQLSNPTYLMDENEDVFRYPYNELLIWAVLMKRHKMAMFVCKRGEETMAKALIAAKLNKALAREAELDDLESEIAEEFKGYGDEFSTLAVGLLDKCYKEDDELTTQLLTYDLVNWSHWTCMSLAVTANLKDFLSHAACQLLISDLWMGGMKIRKHVTYKIIAALLFPPFLFAIQFKSAKELQYMPQTQEEYEHNLDSTSSSSSSSSSSDIRSNMGSARSMGGASSRHDSAIHLNDFGTKSHKMDTSEPSSSNRHDEAGLATLVNSRHVLNAHEAVASRRSNFSNNSTTTNNNNNNANNGNNNNMLKFDQIIELYDAQYYPMSHHHQQHQESARGGEGGDELTKLMTPSVGHSTVTNTMMADQRSKTTLGVVAGAAAIAAATAAAAAAASAGASSPNTTKFLVTNRATNKLRFGKKIYEFYNAPITKFWQNAIMYIVFLINFTYMVLVKTPQRISIPEMFVLIYVFSYGVDKMRELLQTDSPRFSGKVKIFFSKIMNTLDMFFITSLLLALVLRLLPAQHFHVTARLIYCVNTIYWIIKLMEFLLINKNTGLLIIIASKMLVDLVNFVVILLILLMCFGLSRQAIKFPNEDFKWSLVKNIFLEPYFMLYGEVYAHTIDPECSGNFSDNSTELNVPECQPGHWITPLTMTAFMIVSCLLFLSILIASFNNTFVRISRQSAQFWKCQRYHFVTSYEAKPLLPPPFVIISHLFMIVKYFVRLCQRKKITFDRKLKAFLSDDMIQRLHDFEEDCTYHYSADLEQSLNNMMENKINQTRDRTENIGARIDDIFFKENITKLSLYKVELRLQKLEELNYETLGHLNRLAESLAESQSQQQSQQHEQHEQSQQRRRLNASLGNRGGGGVAGGGGGDFYCGAQSSMRGARSGLLRKRLVTISDTNELVFEDQQLINAMDVDAAAADRINRPWRLNQSLRYPPTHHHPSGVVYQAQRSMPSATATTHLASPDSASSTTTTTSESTSHLRRRNLSENATTTAAAANAKNDDDEDIETTTERKYLSSHGDEDNEEDVDEEAKNMFLLSSDDDSSANSFAATTTATIMKPITVDTTVDGTTPAALADHSAPHKPITPTTKAANANANVLNASIGGVALDQFTLHPFVYLHSVIKPPLVEYTSITDCIDTSCIDRPPSPPLSSLAMSHSNNKANFLLNNMPATAASSATGGGSGNTLVKHVSSGTSGDCGGGPSGAFVVQSNPNDYCTLESARSMVARQESEILRLAEESQHFIISQLFNNMATMANIAESSATLVAGNAAHHLNTQQQASTATTAATAAAAAASTQAAEEAKADSMITTATATGQSSRAHARQLYSQSRQHATASSMFHHSKSEEPANEASATDDKNSLQLPPAPPRTQRQHSLTLPISSIDRKSSQIFYAQSQANALCLNIDDDDDDDDGGVNNNNDDAGDANTFRSRRHSSRHKD